MYLKKLSKNINFDSKIVKAKIIEVKGSSPNSLDDIILISTDTIFGTIAVSYTHLTLPTILRV